MGKRLVCRVAEVPENGLKECEAEGGLKLVVANAGGHGFYRVRYAAPLRNQPSSVGPQSVRNIGPGG